uniref:Uncharacterized protein n=1 Tax=Sus scrofa TaxID=9823 RepID=A0A4X1SSK1_PIG
MEEYSRALPRGIVADCGGGFTMGTIGGGIFQAIKGFRLLPRTCRGSRRDVRRSNSIGFENRRWDHWPMGSEETFSNFFYLKEHGEGGS